MTVVILTATGCAGAGQLRPEGDACAQQHAEPSSTVPRSPPGDAVAPGTLAGAQVMQPISSRHSRPGDRFTAELLDPLVDGEGREVVARGTMLEGVVVRTESSMIAGDSPQIEVRMTGARRPGEGLVALPLEVAQAPIELEPVWRRGVIAGLAGAAAGAGAGLAIDSDHSSVVLGSAIVGAGVGALLGAIFGGREARVESGSVLTLRVSEPIASEEAGRPPETSPPANGTPGP